MTLHFIYAQGEHIATPFAITNELEKRLRQHFELKTYDWQSSEQISPSPGDLLLGHPHPTPGTIFRNSFWNKNWKRRIIICPFAHASPDDAYLDSYVRHADKFLAICGNYWVESLEQSIFSSWKEKLLPLDLAVNREHFPRLKQSFAPPGKRKFLYIGRVAPYKGLDYLIQLSEALPELEFTWAGPGELQAPRIKSLGVLDFRTPEHRSLIAEYDFLINCGRADANPTTILEAASWGLVNICTPQSGYTRHDWIFNIPLDDIPSAQATLSMLNNCSEDMLIRTQSQAFLALDAHFNWDRFASEVIQITQNLGRAAEPTQVLPSSLRLMLLGQLMLLRGYLLSALHETRVRIKKLRSSSAWLNCKKRS